MVRSCSLKNCNNSVKQKYRFFLLPSVKKVAKRAAWLKNCGHLLPERLPMHGNSISLCEGHFEPDQFVEYGPHVRTLLKPTAVPTIFTRNPPKVCDAIQSLYEEILEEGSINDESTNKMAEEMKKYKRLHDNDENKESTHPVIKNDISLIKSHKVDANSPPPLVQLLKIKKNRMVMSNRQNNEIIQTSTNKITPKVNQQYHNNKSKSESLLLLQNNDTVKRIERIEKSRSGENITLITKDKSVVMRLCKPRKKIMHVPPLRYFSSMKNQSTAKNKSTVLKKSTTNINSTPNNKELSKNSTSISKNLGVANSQNHSNNSSQNNSNSQANVQDSSTLESNLLMETAALQKQVHDLEIERDNAIRKYRHFELKLETLEANLRLFLNDDQIRFLESESASNTIPWSPATLQKSAKIRCIVGPRAYEYLRSQENYPFPSFRTLYRHRDISKINEYTSETVQEHVNSTIDEVAATGTDDSEASDAELEHIKIEMLEPEYENSMECHDDEVIIENDVPVGPKEIYDDLNVMEYVTLCNDI